MLNQAQVGFILIQTPSVLTKLAQISAEYTPRVITAHSEVRLLTFEQARSFLHDTRSIWYPSSPSSCHELSNDMLDYILFVRVSNNSTKNFVSGDCSKFVHARVKSPPPHNHGIAIGKVNTCTQCAAMRNIRFLCGFLLQNPNSLSFTQKVRDFSGAFASPSVIN